MFSNALSQIFSRKDAQKGLPTRRRPRIGGTICYSQFRMTVTTGFTRDLWLWLEDKGWRVMPDEDNRYRYRALPSHVIAALVDAAPEQREALLSLALRAAAGQPVERA